LGEIGLGSTELVEEIKVIQGTLVKKIVEKRLREFKHADWFGELCYCILTANSTARKALEVQEKIGKGFFTLSLPQLQRFLKKIGYRFPNKRAEYIVAARKHAKNLRKKILGCRGSRKAREWLVENIRGLGWKEASHFLRNVGYENIAIIDRHVLNVLKEHKVINRIPKNLNEGKYLEMEKTLERVAEKLGMPLGELDLYLWFKETESVLK
jgi:N-glycosylase/DNA lyase